MDVAGNLELVRDEAPPESGVRLRSPAPLALVPAPVPDRDVMAEVAQEVFSDVFGLVSALSPLQGPWLRLSLRWLGGSLWTMAAWRHAARQGESCEHRAGERPAALLRNRWPELVPGHAAMDRLVRQMVDLLCA